VLKLMIDRT
jgi:hypothetical protein